MGTVSNMRWVVSLGPEGGGGEGGEYLARNLLLLLIVHM